MDLHYSQTLAGKQQGMSSFTTLWIYTILKQVFRLLRKRRSFTTLWIYTILKQAQLPCACCQVSLPYGFTLFSNYEYQQETFESFHYLMDLHYSQTCWNFTLFQFKFHYLMDLHYSQTIHDILTDSR